MCGCFSHAPYWGPCPQPGMCPDWESNQPAFGSQADTQSTEQYQPGQKNLIFKRRYAVFEMGIRTSKLHLPRAQFSIH